MVALFAQYKHVCTKWSFAVSSLCLAHHAVRLWRSPRRGSRGATNPVQIRWKSHVSFPLSEGRSPSLIRRNRWLSTEKTAIYYITHCNTLQHTLQYTETQDMSTEDRLKRNQIRFYQGEHKKRGKSGKGKKSKQKEEIMFTVQMRVWISVHLEIWGICQWIDFCFWALASLALAPWTLWAFAFFPSHTVWPHSRMCIVFCLAAGSTNSACFDLLLNFLRMYTRMSAGTHISFVSLLLCFLVSARCVSMSAWSVCDYARMCDCIHKHVCIHATTCMQTCKHNVYWSCLYICTYVYLYPRLHIHKCIHILRRACKSKFKAWLAHIIRIISTSYVFVCCF